jgi:dolichol-phosphate hexosyltransferase
VKLSVLMPVYNEEATLKEAVDRLLAVTFPCDMELVIVDDGSRDATPDLIDSFQDERLVKHRHTRNQGKGAAIRTAAGLATGDHIVMYDADLEYRPEEIPALVQPILVGEATVVFGSRSFGANSAYSFWYVMGNKGITLVANVLYNSYISDLETCYKLMPADLYRELQISSAGFGMEAEITGKLLRRGVRPFEVPISYRARTREEGKKITWKDGVEAVAILARIRVGKGR